MAGTKFNLPDPGDDKKQDHEELQDILNHIEEVDEQPSRPAEPETEEEVYQKPSGAAEQPEDLDGMLNMLTETESTNPAQTSSQDEPLSFWQKIIRFFTGQ